MCESGFDMLHTSCLIFVTGCESQPNVSGKKEGTVAEVENRQCVKGWTETMRQEHRHHHVCLRRFVVYRLMLVALLGVPQLPGAIAGNMSARADPLIIGQTFEIRSAILNETRRINVYVPRGVPPLADQMLPVLYMPDGGMSEDFLHIAGLIEVSAGNNTMRPWLLVGIENIERTRDLTGPTEGGSDQKIAPNVGGSQCFRDFIRKELMPEIRVRYKTTGEAGIVGESLAGLFVLESFVLEPDLFDRYVAVDPSLWWNGRRLLAEAASQLSGRPYDGKALFMAASSDADATDFMQLLDSRRAAGDLAGLYLQYMIFPNETHATVFHPAALAAFRAILSKPAKPSAETSPSAVSPPTSMRLVNGVCKPFSTH
jgi:predicted alpha/beta superfamily hydrolase